MKKSIFALALIAMCSASLTSCKKDKENPVITVSTPEQHSNHKWGEAVHIDATFSDDRDLKHYHVYMGDKDGNHVSTIDFMHSGDIEGETFDFHKHFMVPDNAPAMAWVYFEVKDAEDKVTELKWMLHFEE